MGDIPYITTLCLNGTLPWVDFMGVIMGNIPSFQVRVGPPGFLIEVPLSSLHCVIFSTLCYLLYIVLSSLHCVIFSTLCYLL